MTNVIKIKKKIDILCCGECDSIAFNLMKKDDEFIAICFYCDTPALNPFCSCILDIEEGYK